MPRPITSKVTKKKTARPLSRIPAKTTTKRTDARKNTRRILTSGREKLTQLDLQPIWKLAKKELQGAIKVLGKGTEKAANKTRTMGKQASIQYQVYLNQLKLQKLLVKLGGRVYDLAQTKSSMNLKDSKASEILKRVKDMDKKILSLKEKAKGLK